MVVILYKKIEMSFPEIVQYVFFSEILSLFLTKIKLCPGNDP